MAERASTKRKTTAGAKTSTRAKSTGRAKTASARKASGAKKTTARATGKRDVVETPNARMFAQRTATGKFADLTKSGKSVARDRKTKAKTVVKPGYGHRGDQKR